MSQAKRLREMLRGQGMVIAPGAYDGITARLIDQAGFPAVYMTGAGTAAAAGYPDLGLVTMTEMVENAGRIAAVVGVPVIADADTGFGTELHAYRAVREFERRGVAAIHIEDQEFPKRCGHLDGKQVVPAEEFVAKIRAAAAARLSPDFTIIARTDARATHGLDEAIARANAALDAGADMAFVEAPQSAEEMEAIPRRVRGPCLLNVHRGGKTPNLDLRWAEEIGYKVAIVPGLLLRSVVGICERMLDELKTTNRHPLPVREFTTPELHDRLGRAEWDALRDRFKSGEAGRAAAE
ncbi:isocitrate lyase/PEP mutase family protein [Muricoccus radiodurans]|uniref:isocitrate lyase/PEP mutase family protein n=1 Tax=Muricoccus radiodurans TaxID=2231721 RepID=UPI003CED18AA